VLTTTAAAWESNPDVLVLTLEVPDVSSSGGAFFDEITYHSLVGPAITELFCVNGKDSGGDPYLGSSTVAACFADVRTTVVQISIGANRRRARQQRHRRADDPAGIGTRRVVFYLTEADTEVGGGAPDSSTRAFVSAERVIGAFAAAADDVLLAALQYPVLSLVRRLLTPTSTTAATTTTTTSSLTIADPGSETNTTSSNGRGGSGVLSKAHVWLIAVLMVVAVGFELVALLIYRRRTHRDPSAAAKLAEAASAIGADTDDRSSAPVDSGDGHTDWLQVSQALHHTLARAEPTATAHHGHQGDGGCWDAVTAVVDAAAAGTEGDDEYIGVDGSSAGAGAGAGGAGAGAGARVSGSAATTRPSPGAQASAGGRSSPQRPTSILSSFSESSGLTDLNWNQTFTAHYESSGRYDSPVHSSAAGYLATFPDRTSPAYFDVKSRPLSLATTVVSDRDELDREVVGAHNSAGSARGGVGMGAPTTHYYPTAAMP
jgi:hypothetical protein